MRRLVLWALGAAAVLAMMVMARLAWAPAPVDTAAPPGDPPAAGETAEPGTGADPAAPPDGATEPPPVPQVADGEAYYLEAAEERAIALGPADKRFALSLPQPFQAKGIYLTGHTVAGAQFDNLLALVERTELNAMVIDVKNDWGGLTYCSQLPNVPAGATRHCIKRLPELVAKLNARGVYPIARIVVFKDGFFAEENPGLAVAHVNGGLWRDRNQQPWLNPYHRESWDYIIAVAKEAAAMGFKEIQWDYVRFPTDGNMQAVVYPGKDDRTRWDVIAEFLAYSREQLHPYGVAVSADIFGFILSAPNDQGIGQLLESLAPHVDIICPMIYPSHWGPGNLGLPHPNAAPYETVLRSMRAAQERLNKAGIQVTIRPWLQDFTLGEPRYTAEHVRAQIQATYDAGLSEWLLWNAGNVYTEGALQQE